MCFATSPMPSVQMTVPPPLLWMSLKSGMTSRACSGLSRKCTNQSPSLCQLSSVRTSSGSSGENSGRPKLTIQPSFHSLHQSATLSSPPTSSAMAQYALGAKSRTDTVVWPGMLIFSVGHVDLSVGDALSRLHTDDVHFSAASREKHPVSLRKPCSSQNCFCSSVSANSSCVDDGMLADARNTY